MGMGTRKRRERQEQLWVTHTELANGPGHPFYAQLNSLLDREKFDEFAEAQCAKFYAENNGRPLLAPRDLLSPVVDWLFRRDRFRTWDRLASGGFLGLAPVPARGPGRGDSRIIPPFPGRGV